MSLRKALALFLTTALTMGFSAPAMAADNIEHVDTEISEDTFPDANFRSYVSTNLDLDHSGALSDEEIAATTMMDVSNQDIASLAGLEYFPFLTALNCADNALTALDVASNTRLTVLNCSRNQLTSLDVSALPALETFDCEDNVFVLKGTMDRYDLADLPKGFDQNRASAWKGATLSGSLITPTADEASYTYDCGGGHSATFGLVFNSAPVTITLNAAGGNVSPNAITSTDGTLGTLPEPERLDYTFLGWYLPDGTMAGESTRLTADTTLTARWQYNYEPLGFMDVSEGDWFYNDVFYICNHGLMNGVTDTQFAPGSTTTRGMIATILWRAGGEALPEGSARSFIDVSAESYYYNAVYWAQENGIASGYSDYLFGPMDFITREQLACFLYNQAKLEGRDTTSTADLSGFSDSLDVSTWASTPMEWAVAEGLIGGKGNSLLAPKDNATRAEVAAILHRYMESE